MYRTHLVVWYCCPCGNTFNDRTCSPDDVNMGTWKSTVMGGRTHAFSFVDMMSSTSPRKLNSSPPAYLRRRHTTAPSDGSYRALPNNNKHNQKTKKGGRGG